MVDCWGLEVDVVLQLGRLFTSRQVRDMYATIQSSSKPRIAARDPPIATLDVLARCEAVICVTT